MNIIFDNHGREYTVRENQAHPIYRFEIERHRIRIGYANVHFEGNDVMHLDDLHIKDDAVFPPWLWRDLNFCHFSFPPLRWRTKNFRHRGIGRAMIEFLTGFARTKAAKRIEGEIKPLDFQNNPYLPEWYRHKGFSVVMGDENEAWVAKISLTV